LKEKADSAVVFTDADATRKKPFKPRRKFKAEAIIGLCGALFPLVGFVLFNVFPIALSFGAMFCDVEYGQIDTMVWNNFANFSAAFTDQRFLHSIGITLWLATAQFVSLGIALFIAFLLSKKTFGSRVFQILYFIPYVCSSVAVGIMWMTVFSHNGILNQIFNNDINYLNNPDDTSTLTWAIFISIVWQSPGYGIVMYKAAFAAVNPVLYEAAKIDGANEWKQFVHITLPGIAPTTFFLMMAGIGAGLTMFDAAKLMAPAGWDGLAGLDDMGLTVSYYIYIRTYTYLDMTKASVMSWALFAVAFALQLIVYKVRNRRMKDEY